ncbi:MAG: hypothetical protein J6P13_02760 [Kiritimatiellae bacterium]|nr:hypothetical protein [Kiritimatiellia bacterium]
MKKNMLSLFAAMAATAAFAAANDVLITFSTPGPDKYADGKAVMDGECYALCWSKNFDAFAINSDGTATGGEVVLFAPLAKAGRCPKVVFEVDAGKFDAKGYANGKWAVYLLDTRKFTTSADGKLSVSLAGSLKGVNTSGMVGSAVSVGTGALSTLSGVAATATDVAGDVVVAEPKITGIRVYGGNVYVTVKGAPYLGYGLTAGDTPATVDTDVENATADATGEEEVTIVTPAKAGGGFFKVERRK